MNDNSDTPSSDKTDRLLLAARVFFVLACIPIALMFYGIFQEDALLETAERFPYLGWSSATLGFIAATLFGIHKFKSLRKLDLENR